MNRSLITFALIVLAVPSVLFGQKNPPKTISAGVLNGRALSLPKPEYPVAEAKARATGTVEVRILVDESGKVVSAEVLTGSENASLRQAAVAAAYKATFSPTTLSGKPARVRGRIIYDFVVETNDERLKVLGVSVALTLAYRFSADFDKFYKAMDGEDLKSAVVDAPEFAKELSTLVGMDKIPAEKRAELIDTARSSIQAKMTGSDIWQFELGKRFGDVMAPVFAILPEEEDGLPDFSKLNEATLKSDLRKLRDHVLSAPADFPQDVLARFKSLTALADRDRILTKKSLMDLCKEMMELIETISPEAGK